MGSLRYVAIGLWALALGSAVSAGNWPAWRGPTADGYCLEKDLPAKWSPTENVRWKIALPGPGNSSPIVWGDRIFLTQSLDADGHQRALLCVSRSDGRELWRRVVPFAGKESHHADNPYCSASPVTDGKRVVASFGSAGVLCCDLAGKILWRRDLGSFEHIWGNGASPVIYQDLVILNCGPGERTFLTALDAKTGQDVWKVDQPGGRYDRDATGPWTGSWSTPVLAKIGGRDELLMSWPGTLKDYDPRTGGLRWNCDGLTPLVYTSPLVGPEVVVAMSGFGGSWMGVRTGGMGDVTSTHRLWRVETAPQRIGSGVIVGDYVYIANATGVAQCITLKTGKVVWNERLGGGSWGSLLYSDGKLYVTNLEGETAIFRASPTFEVLARNALNEKTLASISAADGELFIRTYEHLWCIGPKKH